jgi:hypothetical protein
MSELRGRLLAEKTVEHGGIIVILSDLEESFGD